MTSRIPVPASQSPGHSHTYSRSSSHAPASPVPFPPDRAASPLGPQRQNSTVMSTVSGLGMSEGRKKQSKRDEAIRKKIEGELARKRTISTAGGPGAGAGGRGKKKAAPKGSVAALKPSPALTVPENITVSEASQLCAAKRTDCVLVVDEEEGLSGIFTAKDLAYRVSAEGLDPHTTPVSQIMTRNPMVTRDTTSATEALQLMVTKHFRHLPVCNEEGNVVGLLDITKVFHEALEKVERSSTASEQLYRALAGVQTELGAAAANPQTAAMLAYVDALREKTALPDLTTVMDSRTTPATVGPKTTVREVSRLMKERRVTAVCVMEPVAPGLPPRIAGIFTSKDVVLRVIAAGLEASRCSVVRVMTPHPDTAPPSMSVHEALKKMYAGHYLNLPVVESDGSLVAIVDVLKLTYATLEQMNHMTTEAGGADAAEHNGGPMWGRFFESIGGEDTESAISGSHAPPSLPDFPSQRSGISLSQLQQSPFSEVHPNDSASVMNDDDGSVLDGYPRKAGVAIVGSAVAATVPVDDGTYVFKFRTPSGRTHRFQAREDNLENLRDIIGGKLVTDPFFAGIDASGDKLDPFDFQLSYTDADGDAVLMTADGDVSDAVKIARGAGADRVVLFVQGEHWVVAPEQAEVKAAEAAAAIVEEVKEIEKVESKLPEGVALAPPATVHAPAPVAPVAPFVPAAPELVMGIPKEMLLPASIGALAVAVIAVFAISRMSSR